MPNISKIQLPSGTTYDLRDSRVDNINSFDYIVSTNAANTPKDVTWDDGGTTITGTLVAASTTMYKIYLVPSSNGTNDIYDEYITVNATGTTYKWEMFGNTKLPDMTQYVKNASGHSGGTAGELAYKSSASGSTTVAVPKTYTTTVTPTAKDVSVTGTTTGSVSFTKSTVDVKPNATGTAANKYTPAGTNASSAVSGSCSVTPQGSINVTTSNVSKYVATSATGGGAVTAGTAASCTMPTYTVASNSETLVISAGSFTANTPTSVTLPSFSSQSIATGIDTKTFTGSSSTGTISGTAAAQTFTGADTYLKTAVEVGTAASFTGASMTSTGSYTPATPTASTTTATTEDKTVSITVS